MPRLAPLLVLVVAAVALWAGWREFWFLCDDAYIEFRYVSNALQGRGYVWNPPPWRPVEGYTSFLWLVVLEAAWRLGFEPPVAAPGLSLGFSAVSVGLVATMAWRLPLTGALAGHRVAVLAAVLASTLSNRTFLAWTSSGLETAFFSSVVLGWVAVAVYTRSLWGLTTLAGVMALVRPDGLLYAAASGVIVLMRVRTDRRALLTLLPLLLPVAHVAWRLDFYGYPLPNTYYAKHVGPWPLAGVGYLASFLLEYAYWVWLGVMALGGAAFFRYLRAGGIRAGVDPAWIGITTVVAHFAYYTFNVGGDHFEYRVYHHLVPLLALTFFAVCDRLTWPARRTWAVFAAMTALGLVLPWTHWWHTRTAVGHKEPGSFRFPIAAHVPAPIRPYAQAWDALQHRLLGHFIGIRHQGHRTYLGYQASRYPAREEGAAVPLDGYPVFAAAAVGYPAWSLPNVAIIDTLGLNDLVVARTPARHTDQTKRKMAHDRQAPKGYAACFRPNVTIDRAGALTVTPREVPLAESEIRACEADWLARVTR